MGSGALIRRRAPRFAALAAFAIAAATIVGIGPLGRSSGAPACPAGYVSYAELEAREQRELARHGLAERETGLAEAAEELGMSADACISTKHPESMAELAMMNAERTAMYAAPSGRVPPRARARAMAEREAIAQQQALLPASQLPFLSNPWKPVGIGPLQSADEDYDSVNGLGLVELEGRITDFAYNAAADDLYASVSSGGVWRSEDQGRTWVSIGDTLPTQVVGSVAFTTAGGGTILALTGDGSFGAGSYEGLGVYRSTNGGATWTRSNGVPNDAFGFKLAVDPTNPSEIYAATGAGLFRSTDAGVSFADVQLPTGPCAGMGNRAPGCLFANIVTDVVVQAPGGALGVGELSEPGGIVVASVGWRGGTKTNPPSQGGGVQSPNNGIYRSTTGAPGSFAKLVTTGFTPQNRIGRIELGATTGLLQDHDYLYAIVQDAVLLAGGAPGIDAPGELYGPIPNVPTVLDGVYASSDFGTTWTKLVDGPTQLQSPTTGSALAIVAQAVGNYGPGVQAWYNDFVVPDPTRQDALGVPTRLVFGLEEVWQNTLPLSQNTPQDYKVIGRYFSGQTCLFLNTGVDVCPDSDPLEATTTTHPDQHAAIFVPQLNGGVKLVVGNDGGVYTQTVAMGGEFDNTGWGVGSNDGFNTLLPYHTAIANDYTVWMGLQDNGSAKIQEAPDNDGVLHPERQIMTFGGDGFFVAVDPNDSDTAYSETTFADMRSTVDGGRTWTGMAPTITDTKFSNPFVMDPLDANHLMTAGRQVVETFSGPGTGTSGWDEVYDLGTAQNPGNAAAPATPADPANSMSAIALHGSAAYVGYCGTCDVLNNPAPFLNGLATNVGPGNLWHIADAQGLPNRYITSIAIHPQNPSTIYVTLGGYYRRWTPPGELDANPNAGSGHLFVSTDAGETFRDVSGALPNTPATWVLVRPTNRGTDHLIVGTDLGVFYLSPNGTQFDVHVLGTDLPIAPISSLTYKPDDINMLVAATYGRGIYQFRFGPPAPPGPPPPPPPTPHPFEDQTVATFDFETSDQGWTTTTTADPPALMQWQRLTPGATTPANSFQVTIYTDLSTATLTSPSMTLPDTAENYSSVRVTWQQRTNTEPGFDYVSLQWSSDGNVWNAIEGAAWSGNNPGWPNFAGMTADFVAPEGPVYIRFLLSSDQLISTPPYGGAGPAAAAAVDDILVRH